MWSSLQSPTPSLQSPYVSFTSSLYKHKLQILTSSLGHIQLPRHPYRAICKDETGDGKNRIPDLKFEPRQYDAEHATYLSQKLAILLP